MSATQGSESSSSNARTDSPKKSKRRRFWKYFLKAGEQVMNVLTILSLLFFLLRIYEKTRTDDSITIKNPMRIHQKIRLMDEVELQLIDRIMGNTRPSEPGLESEEVIRDVAERIEIARSQGIISGKNKEETVKAAEGNKEHPNITWWKGLPTEWKRVFARALKKRKSLKISDLQDIMALTDIDLSSTRSRTSGISDLSPLKMLKNLRHLDCSNSPVRDLTPIGKLKNLEILDCRGTQVTDLSALSNLENLKYFDCSGTRVADLKPLARCRKLEGLSFAETPVREIPFVSEMKNLKVLDCSDSKLKSLAPLQGLPELNTVWSSYNKVSDISPLLSLPSLRQVSLYGLDISDQDVEKLRKAKPDCKVKH